MQKTFLENLSNFVFNVIIIVALCLFLSWLKVGLRFLSCHNFWSYESWEGIDELFNIDIGNCWGHECTIKWSVWRFYFVYFEVYFHYLLWSHGLWLWFHTFQQSLDSFFFILINTDCLFDCCFGWRLERFFLEICLIDIFAAGSRILSFYIPGLILRSRRNSFFWILGIESFFLLIGQWSVLVKHSFKLLFIIIVLLVGYLQLIHLRLHIFLSYLWLSIIVLSFLKRIWTFSKGWYYFVKFDCMTRQDLQIIVQFFFLFFTYQSQLP